MLLNMLAACHQFKSIYTNAKHESKKMTSVHFNGLTTTSIQTTDNILFRLFRWVQERTRLSIHEAICLEGSMDVGVSVKKINDTEMIGSWTELILFKSLAKVHIWSMSIQAVLSFQLTSTWTTLSTTNISFINLARWHSACKISVLKLIKLIGLDF